ncbi:hypothetical protein L208DRAFT_1205932, partial [Tricholoma matsutake]
MDRVWHFSFLKTSKEVAKFIKFCKESQYKKLCDWIIDKKSSPWFIPSVNEFMSKILEEDWYLTPGDTNLNESAHPHTNMHIGIGLPILEAIKKAYEFDYGVEAKLWQAKIDCILPNHHNMKPEHDHANCKCKEGHAQPAADRKEAEESLEILDEKIWEASEVQKASKTLAKELCKKKKELKAHTGVKQQASKKGSRGKARIPTKNDMVDENATPVSDAEPDTL